jgi:hypothetical protein
VPVLILSTGNQRLFYPNVRQSIEHACKRWGEDLLVFTEPLGGASPVHDKLLMMLWAADQDMERILLLDRDLLIRADCPCILDWHKPGHLSGVNDIQPAFDGDRWGDEGMDRLHWWCSRCNVPVPNQSYNGGVVLMDPREMREAVEYIYRLDQRLDRYRFRYVDQAGLHASCIRHGIPINWMPITFNRVNIDNKVLQVYDWGNGPMREYVYHFAGTPVECCQWVDWRTTAESGAVVPDLSDNRALPRSGIRPGDFGTLDPEEPPCAT